MFALVVLLWIKGPLVKFQVEEQNCFTPGRSTADKHLAEKGREYRKVHSPPMWISRQPYLALSIDPHSGSCWRTGEFLWKWSTWYRNCTQTQCSCVRTGSNHSDLLDLQSIVRLGCVLALTLFNTDHIMIRTMARGRYNLYGAIQWFEQNMTFLIIYWCRHFSTLFEKKK